MSLSYRNFHYKIQILLCSARNNVLSSALVSYLQLQFIGYYNLNKYK